MNNRAIGNVSVLRLVKHDRAVNQWHAAQLVAIFFGLLLHAFPNLDSLMNWGTPGSRPIPFDFLYFSTLSFFVFILFMTGARTRSEMMYMTIPLSTRRVWLSRILSMLAVSQLSIALMTIVAAYRAPGGGEPAFLDLFTLRLGFHTGAAMAMLTMLLQLPSRELGRIVRTPPFAVYAAFISFVTVFAAILTVGITWASWIFLLAAAAIAVWIRMRLPASFSIMPAEPDRDGTAGAEEKLEEAAAVGAVSPAGDEMSGLDSLVSPALSRIKRHLTLVRVMVNKWNFWLDCLLLLFYATMAVSAYYNGSRDNPWWVFGFIWIFAALMHSVSMLNKVDYLPVSRNVLFGMTMIPVVLSIFLGAGLGLLSVALQPGQHRLINYYDSRLQIPLEFYELSGEGPPPVLGSIWGESHEPESHPVFRGLRTHIYKPYDTGPESSPRFIALQIDRAMEAIHGIERDPLERYDDLDEGFISTVEECCLKVMNSIGRNSETRSRVFALAGILSASFYALIISLQIRFGGRSGPKHPSNFILPGAVILILLVFVSIVVAGRAGLCKPSFVEAVPAILMRHAADAIPFSTAVLWILFAAACVTGYLALQSAYRRFEAPLARTSKPRNM